ncbi:HNH endonuclease [Acinetobacter indicus]|uniref:HNH endonuclease n=1 Tax=Acinetobacter indicus TaxID=756892 RepID=UPI0012662CF2|nr:HNH endonuclease signature motif containing protein [Acinetobacter indicus]QFS17028.1 HNH endonuclease [Acinetobacter indicus]
MKLPSLQTKVQAITPKQSKPAAISWGTGRGGRPWRRLKQKVHDRDMWTCQSCGLVTTALELDHIKNIAQGGTEDESNLQSLCTPCHKKKTQQESRMGVSESSNW